MRRLGLAASAALVLATAGVLVALVPAGSAQSPSTSTVTTAATTTEQETTTAPGTTTAPALTTTTPTTTTRTTTTRTATTPTTTTAPKRKPTPKARPSPKARPRPAPKPRPLALPRGVTIGGIHVGGLSPDAAYAVVRAAFRAPLVVGVAGHRVTVSPASLGAVAYAKAAVALARSTAPGTTVPLRVRAEGAAVRRLIASVDKRFGRVPVDSAIFLRNLKPFITNGKPGRRLNRRESFARILRALTDNRRTGIELPIEKVPQKVSRATFGPVIVIRRDSNQLYLYHGMRPWRTFGVATGQSVYPTPLGRFEIVVKWENPWWYPPDSPWAKGAKPIPPGPGNPLGTRWMGLTAPGVGIHGTPDPTSIGYSASHGCIRMLIPQAEWLFEHVEVGTPVYIVPA